LIAALIDVESRWNPRAVSNKGAMGLMQLMPATARRFGAVHPFDVDENVAAGTRYVTVLMWEFHGDLRMVAAAYYAGDRWILQKQLNYSNPDVVAYVEAVRLRYPLAVSARSQPVMPLPRPPPFPASTPNRMVLPPTANPRLTSSTADCATPTNSEHPRTA
jgi:soluble lytic murein transglycosylase-like protein